jgi:hypothetical protein
MHAEPTETIQEPIEPLEEPEIKTDTIDIDILRRQYRPFDVHSLAQVFN